MGVVGETRYALSEESYVSHRAVGYRSCAIAFWGGSSDGRMSFDPLHGGDILISSVKRILSPPTRVVAIKGNST